MLQKFGFSQYESKVYEALSSSQEPLDATMIVKQSGVPKAKVYEVISRMVEKGLVLDSVSHKKKLYTALPIGIVIEKLTKEFQLNINNLKTRSTKKIINNDRVWSLKGDASIKLQGAELIQSAKHCIQLTLWNDELPDYLPQLLKKQKEGVTVELVVVGELEDVTNLTTIYTVIPSEEHTLEKNRLFIIDKESILFAGVENDMWQALLTKSIPFVKFFSEFFHHDVALATITRKYEDQLMNDDEIRPLLLRLRY